MVVHPRRRPASVDESSRANRRWWDGEADNYQAQHGSFLRDVGFRWCPEGLDEASARLLGEVRGHRVLELGCGAAQWSVALAKTGAKVLGLDNSERQLEHARRAMEGAGVEFPLLHASAEDVPLPDESLDVVFADHGANRFSDPHLYVPEVARLLRRGGLFAFSGGTPFEWLGWNPETDTWDERLHRDYFDIRRWETPEGSVEFELPYGQWIRLFRASGFVVEELREIRPPDGATSTYRTAEETEWARHWPMEQIWKVRKE